MKKITNYFIYAYTAAMVALLIMPAITNIPFIYGLVMAGIYIISAVIVIAVLMVHLLKRHSKLNDRLDEIEGVLDETLDED